MSCKTNWAICCSRSSAPADRSGVFSRERITVEGGEGTGKPTHPQCWRIVRLRGDVVRERISPDLHDVIGGIRHLYAPIEGRTGDRSAVDSAPPVGNLRRKAMSKLDRRSA